MSDSATKTRSGWEYRVNNKLRGAFGEADFDKKVIAINKKAHKQKGESVIDTLVHETMHKNHPDMKEKTVRKKTPALVQRMSQRSKQKLYNKI